AARRQLERGAAGAGEVDAPEVGPVQRLRGGYARAEHRAPALVERDVVVHLEGHVVVAAAPEAPLARRRRYELERPRGLFVAAPRRQPDPVPLPRDGLEAQQAAQQLDRKS